MDSKNNTYLLSNVQLISEWDWNRNEQSGLDPKGITCNSRNKAWWICPNGHSYQARISNRSQGGGCPYCAGKRVLVGFNDLKKWCIDNDRMDLIEEFDEDKNSFSMTQLTRGSGKQIWWKCPNGHSYCTSISHRTNMRTGCGICSHKVFLKGYNDLQTTHPEIALEFDTEKNGLSPDQVMAGSNNKKYWFVCPKGHSYSATLLNRKKGKNCPICAKELHVSFPEKAIMFYLQKMDVDIEENYRAPFLNKMELDLFLIDYKLAIEYDGRAWHRKIERDMAKDEVCQNNGISLIRIREEGCPVYKSTSIKHYIRVNDNAALEDAIRFIADQINQRLKNKIVVDINLERDRNQIYELLELNEKKNSLLAKHPEIEHFWNSEANGKLSPNQISHSSLKRIHLICPNGHRWVSTAYTFVNSKGCPICSGERILEGFNDLGTTHPALRKIWSQKNDHPIDHYSFGSNAIAIWECDICHGEYQMQISNKARLGYGCPYCSNRRLLKGFNDLKTKHPDLSKEWSSQNYKQPDDYLPHSKELVYWECEKHHVYQGSILSRTIKHKRCPYCYNLKLLIGFNDLQSCNPSLAEQFDSEKNALLPTEVVYGGTKSYWWKCPEGHSYTMTIAEKKRGYGCPICSNSRVLPGYNDLETINPDLAREFNIKKNNGKTARDFVAKSGKKVWWTCFKCGHEWPAQICKRNKGQGCPICSKEKLAAR